MGGDEQRERESYSRPITLNEELVINGFCFAVKVIFELLRKIPQEKLTRAHKEVYQSYCERWRRQKMCENSESRKVNKVLLLDLFLLNIANQQFSIFFFSFSAHESIQATGE